MEIKYIQTPPKRYTFEMKKVKEWTELNSKGLVLNLFAGKTKLNLNEIRVDINKEMTKIDYIMDSFSFINFWIEEKNDKFDTIILDPPYSLRKAREKYDISMKNSNPNVNVHNKKMIGSFTIIKNVISNILAPEGRVLTFGYNSTGLGNARGFKKTKLLLINHFGDYDDTMGIIEEQKDLIGIIEKRKNKQLRL